MAINIPLRAKSEADFPTLKAVDKKIIAAAVLLQLDNQSAFALYHPEYIDGTGRLNAAGKQDAKFFWNYGKNKEYRQAYEETIETFLNKKQSDKTSVETAIDDSRKDRALKSLLNQAMSLVEGGSDLDAETIKMCSDIFTKLGLIKSEVEQQIRPIRVLPSLCRECRYKAFVESSVLNNEAIDCCAWCKARKIAEENGYRFNDGKDLLEIPQEIIDELESKNNVKLTDILNGSVEN